MPITDQYERIPCSTIIIPEDRQRKDVDASDLEESVRSRGVLQPIIIRRDLTLVAGERRLRASMAVGLPDIPIRYLDHLSDYELQIVELEENIKRKPLEWRHECAAIAKLHELYCQGNTSWSQEATASELSMSQGYVAKTLRVASDLESPKIATAISVAQAFNTLTRQDERRAADKMSNIIEAATNLFKPKAVSSAASDQLTLPAIPPAPEQKSILNQSFLEWAPQYDGAPFTFLHCDFPYGAELFRGSWSGRNTWQSYEDSKEVYWALIRTLCANIDRLLAPSAHLMFWFSMQYYSETLEMFHDLAPDLEFSQFPLIWWKTDNVGIAPDPKRWPRRVYETALIASRGERPIVKTVSNVYGAPTDKKWHPSTKPEPMLHHFFTMFCDETTRMLDPTCGGGSALRAAERHKAELVLGLEIDPEYAKNAETALKQFRNLQRASL